MEAFYDQIQDLGDQMIGRLTPSSRLYCQKNTMWHSWLWSIITRWIDTRLVSIILSITWEKDIILFTVNKKWRRAFKTALNVRGVFDSTLASNNWLRCCSFAYRWLTDPLEIVQQIMVALTWPCKDVDRREPNRTCAFSFVYKATADTWKWPPP